MFRPFYLWVIIRSLLSLYVEAFRTRRWSFDGHLQFLIDSSPLCVYNDFKVFGFCSSQNTAVFGDLPHTKKGET